ncbi:carotenoid oxygenase family protein [Roseateles aquae]|nr:carotenoid oxygenase family protein [Paucibacter sp. APW11]
MQRRQLLQAGAAGAALGLSHLQEALALGLGGGDGFAAGVPELLPLQGLDGRDLEARDLQIEGRLPAALRGTYYKNGPGLMSRGGQRYRHWFDGDGLVQAWRFDGGRVSHQARFVQTQKFRAESQAGRFLLPAYGTAIKPELPITGPDSVNVANTSVLRQGGRLYALWEGGSAYELDADSLAAKGPRVWAPELAGMPFSAHPKVEADGTLWNFGSTPGGRLALYQISPQGQVLRSTVFKVPASTTMVHDFVVTERYLVFLLAPIHLDMQAVHAGSAMLDAMSWVPADGTQLLLVSKADFNQRRLFSMPAAMVFHFGNGWDDGKQLQLDYVEAPALPEVNVSLRAIMRGERRLHQPSTPRFLRLDLDSGRITLQSREESVEFPVVDPRVVAQRYRHVWYPAAIDTQGRWGYDGLLHLDIESGRRQRFCFGQDVVVEEHVLVPKPGSSKEGEGWLLGLCFDSRRQRSFASVFDAQAISAGPLAKVWLPYWVTYGFHGKFYAA